MNGRCGFALVSGMVILELLAGHGTARARDRVPVANREFLRGAAESAATQALEGLPVAKGDTLALRARNEGSRSYWEEVLIERLTEQGLVVRRLEPAPPAPRGRGAPRGEAPGSGAPAGASPSASAEGAGGATGPVTVEEGSSGRLSGGGGGLLDMAKGAAADSGRPLSDAGATGLEGGHPSTPDSVPGVIQDSFEGPCLQFESEELAVAYPRSHGGHLFGDVEVERQARAGVFLDLCQDGSGNISWTGRGSATMADRVKSDHLPEVESPSVPGAPKWEGRSLMGRLAEPALVVGIVGGLVYLFYANRSD